MRIRLPYTADSMFRLHNDGCVGCALYLSVPGSLVYAFRANRDGPGFSGEMWEHLDRMVGGVNMRSVSFLCSRRRRMWPAHLSGYMPASAFAGRGLARRLPR